MKNIFFYETVIGKIAITEANNNITGVYFINNTDDMCAIQTKYTEINETFLIKKAGEQLQQYLEAIEKYFDLPLLPCGTKFQRCLEGVTDYTLWETWSYKQVAERLGSPKAARAVGMANNKIYLFYLPSVIGSNGNG